MRNRRLLVSSVLSALVMLLLVAVPGPRAAGQSPTATAAPAPSGRVVGSGDPRSEGEGPGLVGSPALIALSVIGLGLLAAGGTVLYVRLTRDE